MKDVLGKMCYHKKLHYSSSYLYATFVRPHLEYAQVVWSPKLRKTTKLIEGVKRSVAFKNHPYQSRLELIGILTLKYRRAINDNTYHLDQLNNDQNPKSLHCRSPPVFSKWKVIMKVSWKKNTQYCPYYCQQKV